MSRRQFTHEIYYFGWDKMPFQGVYRRWRSACDRQPRVGIRPPMKRSTIIVRAKLAGLIALLACSELLASGQSNLQPAKELVAKGSFHKAEAILRQPLP